MPKVTLRETSLNLFMFGWLLIFKFYGQSFFCFFVFFRVGAVSSFVPILKVCVTREPAWLYLKLHVVKKSDNNNNLLYEIQCGYSYT